MVLFIIIGIVCIVGFLVLVGGASYYYFVVYNADAKVPTYKRSDEIPVDAHDNVL